MNMEMSLISAHLLLLYGGDPEMVIVCKVVSFLIHLFHVTCFVFMFLEALYTYSLVAFVVKRDGLLTRKQNIAVGWGTGIGITLIVVSLEWKNYGGTIHFVIIQNKLLPPPHAGEYHCWLQMNTTLMIGQYVPIVVLAILTLTLIEAAGAAEYR